ncbi:MAG: methyltransferase domain-containing protein [Rhodospirillaceae bacterium]|nr:methyltransferase domain-containing protein [Rhodospirillaceae bacterium]
MTRTFSRAVDLGARNGHIAERLQGSAKVEWLAQSEFSWPMTMAAARHGNAVCVDEEILPFADGALDLVLSNLALHWVNDLPGALIQVRRALRPDGLFLAAMFGSETLRELRASLLHAETDLRGGASPRVSPFVDVRDAGQLLNRAGFALPVVDSDTITVTYTDIFKLMTDLRGMGETNAVHERRKTATGREIFARAGEIYGQRHADERGRLIATFQIVTLTAWAPHQSQQKALRPGSAKARLSDALNATEVPLDDRTPFPVKDPS